MPFGMDSWREVTTKEKVKYKLLLDYLYKIKGDMYSSQASEFIDDSQNRLMLVTNKDEEGYRAILVSCSILK